MRKRVRITRKKRVRRQLWRMSPDDSWALLSKLCRAQCKGIEEVMAVALPHLNHLDENHLDVIISTQQLIKDEVENNRKFLVRVLRQQQRRKIRFSSMIPAFRFSMLEGFLFPTAIPA